MSIVLKTLAGLIGLLLAYLGLTWMFSPDAAASGVGIALGGDLSALSTARGDLGGMFIAGATMCALGLLSHEGRWLQAVAIVIGSVALGRIVGIALDGFAAFSLRAAVVELAMVGILLAASRSTSPAES